MTKPAEAGTGKDVEKVALKCCPFCWETRRIEHADAPGEIKVNILARVHWFYCRNKPCGASGPVKDSLDEAALAWNRRW